MRAVLKPYVYSRNNPLNMVDPSGLADCDVNHVGEYIARYIRPFTGIRNVGTPYCVRLIPGFRLIPTQKGFIQDSGIGGSTRIKDTYTCVTRKCDVECTTFRIYKKTPLHGVFPEQIPRGPCRGQNIDVTIPKKKRPDGDYVICLVCLCCQCEPSS